MENTSGVFTLEDESFSQADIVAALTVEIPEHHKLARSLEELSDVQLSTVATIGTPKCFEDERQYRIWRELAIQSKLESLHGFCTDCTAEYKAQMVMNGRCQFPNTIFVRSHGIRMFFVPKKRSRLKPMMASDQ